MIVLKRGKLHLQIGALVFHLDRLLGDHDRDPDSGGQDNHTVHLRENHKFVHFTKRGISAIFSACINGILLSGLEVKKFSIGKK